MPVIPARRLDRRLPALALITVALFLAAPLQAQDRLQQGTWSGMVYPPDADMIPLDYAIRYEDDTLVLELLPPAEMGMGAIPADNPTFVEGTLSFTLNVGEVISCSLFQGDDGHLEGECVDSTGGGATMTMFPPEGG